MDKIYKDANDVPVVSTIIYIDVSGITEGNTFFTGYKDEGLEETISPSELKEAFIKGCVIFCKDLTGLVIPIGKNVLIKPYTYSELDSEGTCPAMIYGTMADGQLIEQIIQVAASNDAT